MNVDYIQLFIESNGIKILTVAFVVYVVAKIINKTLKKVFSRFGFLNKKDEETIRSVVHSILKYGGTIVVVGYIFSLYFDVSKVLAGAGVLGVILGFGAKRLIRDSLAGFFLLYEGQLLKGDFVTINGTYSGTVENISIRYLMIREWSGKLLTINNGEIREVQNYNEGKMRLIERFIFSYREEPKQAKAVLETIVEEINEAYQNFLLTTEEGEIVEPFQFHGMTVANAQNLGYEMAVTGLVKDHEYFQASRTIRFYVMQRLFEENIQLAEANNFHQARL